MRRWRKRVGDRSGRGRSGRGRQTLSGRGASVYSCTCVRDNIPCRRLPK